MKKESGSVIVFILIGIVLFAALSYTVTQSFNLGTGATDRASEDKAQLSAGNILDFARALQTAVIEMRLNGIARTSLDFILPSAGAFNTAPNEAKVFHVDGGGATYVPVWSDIDDPTQATATDWAFPMNTIPNVGTSAAERLLTLIRVPVGVCEQLNQLLLGSRTISTFSGTVDDLFVTGVTPITAVNCAACDRIPAQCVNNSGVRVFYFVLDRG